MMYKNLTLINGVFIAIMIYLNGMLASFTGPYLGTLLFHGLAFLFILVISLTRNNRIWNFRRLPLIYFLPGILSVITILLNNVAIPKIGVTLTIGLSLFGQLAISSVVEHFGLFKTPINRMRKEKVLGFSIISIGIVVMIIL